MDGRSGGKEMELELVEAIAAADGGRGMAAGRRRVKAMFGPIGWRMVVGRLNGG